LKGQRSTLGLGLTAIQLGFELYMSVFYLKVVYTLSISTIVYILDRPSRSFHLTYYDSYPFFQKSYALY